MKIAECEFCLRKRLLTKNLCRECLRQFEIANADIFGEGNSPTLKELEDYIEEEVKKKLNERDKH